MNSQFILRRAIISDSDALSQLFQKTFRETYIEDLSICYSDEDLGSYFRKSASAEWFANKINDSNQAVWVIEDKTNGELVAVAVAGSCNAKNIPHPDACPDKDGAFNRLFVRRDRQGRGFGKQLMKVVLLWLEEHYPGRPIWIPVFSENVKAQQFYTLYGFSKVGDYDYHIGQCREHDFIMKRDNHPS